jgi:Tol biopolymer transport system component
VSKDAASYAKLSLDQGGDKLIAVQQVPDFRISSLEGKLSRTFSVARDMAVSRSGKIVYSTFDGEVWSMNRDGTGQRQLSNTENAEFSLCVSPDDKAIFFSSDEGGVRQIWRMNADGTERKQLTTGAGGFPSSVAGDGQSVFFTAALGGQIYRVPSEGGEAVMLHDKPLVNPVVSPDGRFAAHFTIENMSRKIAVMDLQTKENVKLIGVEPGHYFARPLAWSGDGQTLYYVVGKGGVNALWRRQLASETSDKMADLLNGEILSISNADDGSFTYISGSWRFDVMLLRGLGVKDS